MKCGGTWSPITKPKVAASTETDGLHLELIPLTAMGIPLDSEPFQVTEWPVVNNYSPKWRWIVQYS